MRRVLDLLVVVVMGTALTSCSATNKMAVGGPSDLSKLPTSQQTSKHHPYYAVTDSSRVRAEGWIVVVGDSLQLFKQPQSNSSLSRDGVPAAYRFDHASRRMVITGYETTDGLWHDWPGSVRAVRDSLEFLGTRERPSRVQRGTPADTLRLAREQVSAIAVESDDPVRTAVTSVVAIGVLAAMLVVGALVAATSLSN